MKRSEGERERRRERRTACQKRQVFPEKNKDEKMNCHFFKAHFSNRDINVKWNGTSQTQ